MNKLNDFKIDLDITLLGGQSFTWAKVGEEYWGVTSERAIKVRQSKDKRDLYWQTYPVRDDYKFFSEYFQVDRDHEVTLSFPDDLHLLNAVRSNPGLRVLKQEFSDTVISYLCSPTKNIPAIRDSITRMRTKYGERVDYDGVELYLFPKVERLAEANKIDLLECRVGFRADNIIKFAQSYINESKYLQINEFSTEDARALLTANRGIGDKVADCVLLYGLGRHEIFPLDRWGFRIAHQYYGISGSAKYDEVREWMSRYFGDYAGVAGQFLFEYIRAES